MDEVALPDRLREEVLKFFPHSRRALMKSGGNFPFLARAEDFNMYVEVRGTVEKRAIAFEAQAVAQVHLRHMKYEVEPQPNLAGALSTSLSRNSSQNNLESLEQQQQKSQNVAQSGTSSSSSSTQPASEAE